MTAHGSEAKHRGCQVQFCPYAEDHHVHHGLGTFMFDPHPFALPESVPSK